MTTTVGDPVLTLLAPDVALLEDKLRIPLPGLAVLARRRISELIDAAAGAPVTLMTGPPGAGKTVAAAQWAAARPASRRPAWVTLDPADAEPGQFWRYVTAALARAGFLAPGQPSPPAGMPWADIPGWIAAAARPGAAEPVVLVLDDVHQLAGSEALAGLDDLIKHAPPGLRLLLTGRSAAGLPLARLRLAGQLADIGAADLACTADETADYFAMLGTPLRPDDCAAVRRQTEGWLAGLRLIALCGQPGGDPAAVQALVGDYLQDEVLSLLPAHEESFLLRTSLTEIVPAGLARELTGETGAARLLEQLSRDNGLVRALAPAAAEYRYHPMLREVLAARLRRELPDEVPELQRQVARWHAGRGEVLAAVRAAAEVGDWEFGLRVLAEAGPAVMLSDAGPGLAAALTAMAPDQITTDDDQQVTLAVALAAARIWQGDADGALPHLESAQAALARLGDDARDQAALWTSGLRVLHRATVSRAEPGWLDRDWALASQGHADLQGAPGHRALGMLWLALGFASLRQFDTQRARAAFLHAGSQLSAGGLSALRDRGRCWEAVAAALDGDLAASARLSASVADGPRAGDDSLIPVLALASAAVSLARDEPDAAAHQLDQADLAAVTPRPAGEPSIAVLSGLLRARAAVADGNLAGARGLVRWLSDAAAGLVDAGYELSGARGPGAATAAGPASQGRPRPRGAMAAVAVLDAEVSLAAGEKERARATLAELGAAGGTAAGQGPVERAGVAVSQARLLIADDDAKGALSLVEPVLADAAGSCSVADRIAALLTAVVARRRLSQPAEAAELLGEALALAEPEDACGPFLAAGPPVRSALTVLISPSSRCAGFAGRILDRFDGRVPRPSGAHSAVLLTDSELAVLRFLPSHMTNQEIAESLFLSINTIKTHLSAVYRKLGVANRRQAIAQGRRLELLLRGWLSPA